MIDRLAANLRLYQTLRVDRRDQGTASNICVNVPGMVRRVSSRCTSGSARGESLLDQHCTSGIHRLFLAVKRDGTPLTRFCKPPYHRARPTWLAVFASSSPRRTLCPALKLRCSNLHCTTSCRRNGLRACGTLESGTQASMLPPLLESGEERAPPLAAVALFTPSSSLL
jgi:hypothetical protein